MKQTLKAGKRWLILCHRWLGIGTGLLFALWIASGLVMLHVPFPKLTEIERLARLTPIAWDRVAVSPDAALGGLPKPPAAFSLEMRGEEPVYRLAAPDGTPRTVSARTGETLGPVSAEDAMRIAGAAPGTGSVEAVFRDQWTVVTRYDRARPFHKVALGDSAGTELYVSAPTGAVVLDTTRFERGWNWVGAVVHWVYLTPLRARPDLWREVVLWLSGVSALGALSGLTIGIWRLRLRRRYPHGAVTPYRGAGRWHHLFGFGAGLALCTFIVSGWLSMNPNRWFSPHTPPAAWLAAYAGGSSLLGLDALALAHLASESTVALRFARLGGRWLVTVQETDGTRTTTADGSEGPSEAAILAAAARALPGHELASVERLVAYDAYWYPNPDPPLLPALRLRFSDPAATWLHIDPASGAILNRLDRSGRANRWLFSALHRLDIPGLSLHPQARLAVQWMLNLLAAVITGTGVFLGARRVVRMARRGA